MNGLQPGIYALTVLRDRDGRPPSVRVRPVVAADARPEHALESEVEDVGSLALAASTGYLEAKGERLPAAWVLDASYAGRAVEGRSCALPMALASLAHAERGACPQVVVATGDLDRSGQVGRVEDLAKKLERACEEASKVGSRVLILYPKCQATECDAASIASHRGVPAAAVKGVDSLTEAVRAAFDLGDVFLDSPVRRLRLEIEGLRYDHARLGELFDRCEALARAAASLPSSDLRAVAEYHALIVGSFALASLDAREVAWMGTRGPPSELRGALMARADVLRRSGPRLPTELVAAHYNFEATEGFQSLDYGAAVERATLGLAVDGLVEGHHSEHRKLLGTRAQMSWSQALRCHAVGLSADARRLARSAMRDVTVALERATCAGVDERHDRGRVRVYFAAATEAASVVGLASDAELERAMMELRVVLGSFYERAADGQPPSQDPTWALHRLYRRWLNQGEPEHVVGHFRRVGDLWDPPSPTPYRELLLHRTPHLPVDEPVCAMVAEAAVTTGDRALAEDLAQAWRISSTVRLATVLRWWPVLFAPAGWKVGAVTDALRDGAASPELPLAARDEAFVRQGLAELRSSDAGSWRPIRARLLQWMGEPVR